MKWTSFDYVKQCCNIKQINIIICFRPEIANFFLAFFEYKFSSLDAGVSFRRKSANTKAVSLGLYKAKNVFPPLLYPYFPVNEYSK